MKLPRGAFKISDVEAIEVSPDRERVLVDLWGRGSEVLSLRVTWFVAETVSMTPQDARKFCRRLVKAADAAAAWKVAKRIVRRSM